MQTLRKRIVEALQKESLDLRQISKRLGIKEKEALDHLEHIERSQRPRQIMVAPAHCLQCGFSFRKRTRLSTPGRCPVCRGEQITPPVFRISSEEVRPHPRRRSATEEDEGRPSLDPDSE